MLALPSESFLLDGRDTQGLFSDSECGQIVSEALPILLTFPPRDGVQIDEEAFRTHAKQAWAEAEPVDAPVIFGGSLIRHFGHFIHESLSRLWWLAPIEGMEGPAQESARLLQQLQADVVFFMPPWLDQGKDLLPYMEAILSLLRLPAGRIWILQRPLRFRHLLIPASVWGFGTKPQDLDQRLGCDTRALMRHLFAHCQLPPAAEVAPGPTAKVYVSRSSLPTGLGRLMGDVVLDPLLAEAGYRVFHPERCSIVEQIRLYSQANDLIFMDGSSLYLLWFAKLRPGTRVRVILRRRQGRWMAEKVLDLLPEAAHIRWEVVDVLRGEALTSRNEWESHNVADLNSLQRQLGRDVPPVLPKPAEEALTAYTHSLVQESTPEQLARVLQALLTTLATAPPRPPSRRQRLYHKVRGLFTSP